MNSRDKDVDRFKAQLEEANLRLLDIEVDGNSQFASLAKQIYGIQDAHTMVRLLVMNEILSNPA